MPAHVEWLHNRGCLGRGSGRDCEGTKGKFGSEESACYLDCIQLEVNKAVVEVKHKKITMSNTAKLASLAGRSINC